MKRDDPDEAVRVALVDSEFRAHLLKGHLESFDIPSSVFNGESSALLGSTLLSPITLCVRSRDHERASRILETMMDEGVALEDCQSCGYDLSSIDTDTCPECGARRLVIGEGIRLVPREQHVLGPVVILVLAVFLMLVVFVLRVVL